MSYNGSGTFLINTAGQPVVSGTVISSTAFNALTADLATGLSTAITKDGQTTVTANIPMSTYKFTGLGVGSAATDSANLSQVQSTVTKLLNSVSGADTITATASPTLAAYAAGQMFYFVAAGDNTTSVTLNIDSLGAKAVTRDGATALAAADIKSGEVVVVVYDGTRFQVVSQLNSAGDARFANVSIASSLYVGGVSTFVGNAGFSANVSIASALSVGGVAAITGATTIGGNLTLSAGTASGVLYLNGSKVATSGANLTYSGTTLSVKAGNGDQLILNNAGERFTQLTLQNNGVTKANLNFDNTNSLVEMYGVAGTSLIFSPNATEAMRLTSTGLGIGTASPAYKLDVSGSLRTTSFWALTGSPAGAGGSVRYIGGGGSSTNWYTNVPTGGSQFWAINESPVMTLDSSGNLGIGTASPGGRLHITTASGNTEFVHNVTGSGTAARTSYQRGGVVQFLAGLGAWSGTDTYQISSSTGPLTTIDSSGNLGIGTVSPGSKLSLGTGTTSTTDTACSFRLYDVGGANGNNYGFGFNTSDGRFAYTAGLTGYHAFFTANTERMRLDSSGNLLVGGTGGGNRLVVSNTTDISMSSGAAGQARFEGNGYSFAIAMNADGAALYTNSAARGIIFGTDETERARITSGGDLLVKKTSFGGTATGIDLGANGFVGSYSPDTTNATSTLAAYSNGASAYRFYVGWGGTVYATSTTITAISDQRLKENIQDIDVGLNAVMALKPRKFDWKAGKGKDKKGDRGWIAQEFEQVFPDMIDTWADPAPEGEEPYKAVNADLIPILVKAIQELKAELDALKGAK